MDLLGSAQLEMHLRMNQHLQIWNQEKQEQVEMVTFGNIFILSVQVILSSLILQTLCQFPLIGKLAAPMHLSEIMQQPVDNSKRPLEVPIEGEAAAPADSAAEKNLDQVILEYLASEIDKD